MKSFGGKIYIHALLRIKMQPAIAHIPLTILQFLSHVGTRLGKIKIPFLFFFFRSVRRLSRDFLILI